MQVVSDLERYRAEAKQIVQDVFSAMLGRQIEPATAAWSPARDQLTSVLYFAGEWRGAILLECAPGQAFAWTARLMGIEQPSCMDEDVRDALGELTNMVAGNLKSVLRPGAVLSMPSVVEGSDYTLRICGGNIVSRLAFRDGATLFWLALVEMDNQRSN